MGVGIVFPGQGAQHEGMGLPWRAHAAWDAVVGRAEDVLGQPVGDVLLGDAPKRTRDAQLAVLLASLLAWEALRPEVPDVTAFAGHSLGQLTALIASGVLSLDDGLRFALARADATQAAADRRPGGMAALLGATEAQVDAACAAAPGSCFMANDNAPGQVVIAGTAEGLDAGIEAAKAAGARKVMVLRVGGAFHTPLMDDARQALRPTLEGMAMAPPSAPVVGNGDAAPHQDADWADRLADHLVQPVRWRQSLETMAHLGVDSLIEVGPGTTLAGMARRTTPDVPVRNVSTPADAGVPVEVDR
ncbi:MAG TPA: ACP S-malonyltransferase [Acidimicrobiales bacterium]|nr:ACP S-malonyltransferase [Acidimicrobiales bacterium]